MKKRLLICIIAVLTVNLYAADAVLEDFTSKLNKRNEWLPVEYLNVMKSKNRDTMRVVAPNLNYEKEWDELSDSWLEWYERYIKYYEIEYIYFDDSTNSGYDELRFRKHFEYKILSLDKQTCFNALLQQTDSSLYLCQHKTSFITPLESLRKSPLYSENPAYYNDPSQLNYYKYDEIIIDAKFIFDGDYLTVYANEDKFKQVYFRCTDDTLEQLKSLISTNSIDFTKVTWPRHADGSCDYDKSKNPRAW